MEDQQNTPEQQEILDHLVSIGGDKVNVAYAIWKTVSSADEKKRASLLKFAAETWDDVKSAREVEVLFITSDEKKAMQKAYGKLSDAMLNSIMLENTSEIDFYEKLYTAINIPVFPDDKAKGYVLYNILIDRLMPYFQVGEGLAMGDDEFSNIKDAKRTEMKMIGHIMAREHQQKTKEAALLIDLLDGIDDRKQRVVLFAHMLHVARQSGPRSDLASLAALASGHGGLLAELLSDS